MDKIRLIVADDHVVMRKGLVALLTDEEDLEVVGQAETGREAISLAHMHQPDIALLDIAMRDLTGLEVAFQLSRELPHVNIIFLTMHEEEAFFFEALQVGAAGYVLKGANSEELLNAIRVVFNGGVYLPPRLAGHLVKEHLDRRSHPAFKEPLTRREREVLALIAQGLTNRDIARQLILSMNTVKTHRLRIYHKLDLRNRAGLVKYAVQRGLLPVSPQH